MSFDEDYRETMRYIDGAIMKALAVPRHVLANDPLACANFAQASSQRNVSIKGLVDLKNEIIGQKIKHMFYSTFSPGFLLIEDRSMVVSGVSIKTWPRFNRPPKVRTRPWSKPDPRVCMVEGNRIIGHPVTLAKMTQGLRRVGPSEYEFHREYRNEPVAAAAVSE